MPTPLSEIPGGVDLFLDANILVYGINRISAECAELLARCSREEIIGICLYEVLNEATHVFMRAEARAKGLIRSEAARELRNKPDTVKLLVDYWLKTQQVLELNILFLPLEDVIIRKAQLERETAGLLTNDSMIVSSMRLYGVTYLATADSDFDTLSGVSVFKPQDLQKIRG